MNKLYSAAFKRILASLSATQINTNNVQSVLESNNIKPIGSYMLYRLPRKDLKSFVKTPCPVENPTSEQNKQIIEAAKSLRANFGIDEANVCSRCPFKQNCQQFAKPGKQTLNAISDLLVYMKAMNQMAILDSQKQFRVWSHGYKLSDSIIATIEDLKLSGLETLQYQKIRLESDFKEEQPQDKQQNTSDQKKPVQQNTKPKNQMLKKGQLKSKFEYNDVNLQQTGSEIKYQRNQDRKQRTARNQFQERKYQNRSRIQQRRQEGESQGYRADRSRTSPKGKWQQKQNNFQTEKRSNNRNQYQRKSRDRFDEPQKRPERYDQRNRQFQREDNRGQRSSKNEKYELRNQDRKYNNQKVQVNRNFDKKFQQSGQIYRNPKIFQSWEQPDSFSEKAYQKRTVPRNNNPIRQNPDNPATQNNQFNKTKSSVQYQMPRETKNTGEERTQPTQERRGRRVKK